MSKFNLNMLTAADIQKRQTLILVSAIGTLVLVLMGFVWMSGEGDAAKASNKLKTTRFQTAVSSFDNESIWIQKSEAKLEELQKENKRLNHTLMSLEEEFSKPKEVEVEHRDTLIADLQEQLRVLEDKMAAHSQSVQASKPQKVSSVKPQTSSTSSSFDFSSVQKPNNAPDPRLFESQTTGIVKGKINLTKTAINQKHIDNYVPTGSHAKAVILGGVDASASVSAASDPKPVLLRLMDLGTLPNQFKSKLKDCHVTAAAYGDVSSERALMRLEAISCVSQSGHVMESQVSGYVAGEDGVTGVRGQVVYRERDLLNHSLWSGLLSGIGKGIESKFKTISTSALGSTEAIANDDILKSSAASGAGNALDKYAQYHIDRAEQYQPTIQIGAGRVVDIVFTRGWSLMNESQEKKNG